MLLFALTGCGQEAEEPVSHTNEDTEISASAEQNSAGGGGTTSERTQNAEPAEEAAGTGTITGADMLSEGQQAILLAYMDDYYQSLAALEVQDCESLFVEDPGHATFRAQVDGTSWTAVTENRTQAAMHHAVWEMIIGIREASGVDLHLLSYDYQLDCLNIYEQEDGCVQVEGIEYADMRFAHTPETVSSVTGVWHSFVMREVDGSWYLTHHAAYDSAYFSFLRWENSSTGRSAGDISGEGLAQMSDEMIQAAEEQILLRQQPEISREDFPEADHDYDREAAAAYAREWAGSRNPRWQAYDGSGGNCMNYVSQCLYTSGIPMDQSGDAVWYWYSDGNRASSWTGVSAFREYAQNNAGYGLSARVGAAYDLGEPGDVILMSTDGRFHHAVIISQIVRDENGAVTDYLICSNTGNYRDFPAAAYVYAEQELVKITGWNS